MSRTFVLEEHFTWHSNFSTDVSFFYQTQSSSSCFNLYFERVTVKIWPKLHSTIKIQKSTVVDHRRFLGKLRTPKDKQKYKGRWIKTFSKLNLIQLVKHLFFLFFKMSFDNMKLWCLNIRWNSALDAARVVILTLWLMTNLVGHRIESVKQLLSCKVKIRNEFVGVLT